MTAIRALEFEDEFIETSLHVLRLASTCAVSCKMASRYEMNEWRRPFSCHLIPQLPLTPEQVLGEYERLGIFGPKDSVRVDLQVVPPEKAGATDLGSLMAKIDFGTGGGMTQGEHGGGMHRTDTIDLAVVLKGEVDIAYPGEDGQVHTTTAKEGDFFVQNGAFHEFHNRSDDPCVILMFVFGAERKVA